MSERESGASDGAPLPLPTKEGESVVIQEALILVRLLRYVSRRCKTAESEGRNNAAYRKAFHLLAELLRGLLVGNLSLEKLKPLFDFLDKSGLVAKIDDSRFDASKRPSQKGGGRGHGQWVTIRGTHIFVDNSGTVTKGPSKFVGLTASEAMSHPEISGSGGKAKSSTKPSADGKNKPCTGFADKAAAKRHRKHWKEFGVTSDDDYTKQAIDFLKQPCGGNIDGYLRADGRIVRFNVSTGEYAVGAPGAEVVTYFKAKYAKGKVHLTAANNYFSAEKKEKKYEQET